MSSNGKIKVFTCQEIIDACKKSPSTICSIKEPKTDKEYKGCKFFPHRFVIGSDSKDVFKINDVEDQHIRITRDMPDPSNKDDERNDFKMCVETNVGAAGLLGQMLLVYNGVFLEKATALNKTFKWGIPTKRKLKGYLATHYSDSCPEEKLRGTEREDDKKTIRINIKPFEVYENHFNKKMIGQPKTIIYDYDTRKVQPDNTVVYQRATVDGEDLTPENIHMFLTSGSVIRKARFRSGCVSRSKGHVSPELVADTLYVQHRSREYDDEEEYDTYVPEGDSGAANDAAMTNAAMTNKPTTGDTADDDDADASDAGDNAGDGKLSEADAKAADDLLDELTK